MNNKRLGTHKYTVLINGNIYVYFLPLMNPEYLTELDLWDVIEPEDYVFKETLFD